MSKLRPLIFIIFLTIPFLTTSLKLDDKMYLLQQEENNLISSHQSNAMSSISLQSTQLHNAEFKLGCQNNFYSFLLRGKYADFVLSNADHPIFSVTQDKNIMFFPSTLTTSQGLNYFGNFKVKGTTQWNLIAEENPKDGVSGWSNNTISHCNGVYMLGGYCKYGNGETVKEYMHLPKHSQIKIEATYHFIDAWDGESGYMKVNNGKNNEMEYVWIEKYSAFLGENGINVCGGRWPEGKFASPISVVIPHKADSLMLAFGATIEQDPCDESFDPNNLTGLCNRNSCPLANSRYATIYEDKGICYLKIKTAERAHTPKELWESIRLDASYKKALEKIDEELIYWPKFIIHKCKQRFTRIRQVLVKRRKIKLEGSAEYQIISRKAEKREKSRLVKAEKAAVIESHIAEELLKNLKKGKYNEIYNYPGNVLERVLENENVIEDKEEQYNEEDFDKGYVVSDYSDEEGEDVDDYEEDEDEEQDEDGNVKEDNEDDYSDIFGKNDKEDNVKDSKSSNKKGGVIGKKTKRKGKVNIEYEQEYETAAPMKKTSTVDF